MLPLSRLVALSVFWLALLPGHDFTKPNATRRATPFPFPLAPFPPDDLPAPPPAPLPVAFLPDPEAAANTPAACSAPWDPSAAGAAGLPTDAVLGTSSRMALRGCPTVVEYAIQPPVPGGMTPAGAVNVLCATLTLVNHQQVSKRENKVDGG